MCAATILLQFRLVSCNLYFCTMCSSRQFAVFSLENLALPSQALIVQIIVLEQMQI
ncbi:hypothetical protein KC19_2G164800 [Ceratodon purpureus]|uniref:Uncharacterized protein n=1 Tax=Ceratodon purpureus TaxID=3225 RepID=A0A8T0IUN2_CERPU|nr:hypothetical protein KC19_2G164800 [Ceratodon purpureus]